MFGIGKNGKAWRQNSGKRKAIEGQHEGQGVSPGPVAIASVFGESSGRSLLISLFVTAAWERALMVNG